MKITNTKIVLLVVVGLAVLVCIFAVWKLKFSTPAITPVNQAALLQLQAELQNVTPHFIDASKAGGQSLTPAEQKIKDDVIAIFVAGHPEGTDYYSQLWLDAVGTRYILVSQPSAESSFDEIIDSQTGKVILVAGEARYYLASEGRNTALYLGTQAIYLYTLDQDGIVLVSGSQLSGNETYHSGTSDFSMVPVQTHTKDSITISVFDSSQMVQNPDAQPNAMQTMNKKVRQITFTLP